MAEFGIEATQLPAAQGRGTQPLSPVQEQVTNYTIPEGIMRVGVGYLQEQAKASKNESPVLKNLNNQLYALDVAQRDGRMSYDEAYKRRRALTASALNASGGDVDMYDNIKKLYNSYSEMTAFEEGAETRKAIRAQNEQIGKAMLDKGFYIPPNASDAYYRKMGTYLASLNKSEAEFQQKVDNINYTTSEYNLNQRVQEDQTKAAVQGWVMDNTVPTANLLFSTATELKGQIDRGELTHEDARLAIRDVMRVPNEQLATIAATHPEAVRGLRDYLSSLSSDFEELLFDPNTSVLSLEREIKTKELQAQAVLMANENVQGAVAITNLLRNNPQALATVNPMLTRAFADLSFPLTGNGVSELGNILEGKDAPQAVNILKGLAKDYRTSEDKQTIDNVFNGFLNYTGELSPTGTRRFDLAKSRESIGFLASNEFAMWRKQGGQLDEAALDGTRQMFENVYLVEVQTPLNNILDTEVSKTKDLLAYGFTVRHSGTRPEVGDTIKYLDAFVVDWTPNGLKFSTREIEGASGLSNAVAGALAEDKVNAEKTLNQMIRAGANIDGITAQEYWEANKHNILPVYYPPQFRDLKVGDVYEGREYTGGAPESRYSWR